MAGLVPAIHAAPRHIAPLLRTSPSSEVYDEAAVYSWMAGSIPGSSPGTAMTEKQTPNPAPTSCSRRVNPVKRQLARVGAAR